MDERTAFGIQRNAMIYGFGLERDRLVMERALAKLDRRLTLLRNYRGPYSRRVLKKIERLGNNIQKFIDRADAFQEKHGARFGVSGTMPYTRFKYGAVERFGDIVANIPTTRFGVNTGIEVNTTTSQGLLTRHAFGKSSYGCGFGSCGCNSPTLPL